MGISNQLYKVNSSFNLKTGTTIAIVTPFIGFTNGISKLLYSITYDLDSNKKKDDEKIFKK
jgi:ABC-type transport system involved in Fe-S cluster assembly fused permease/ATPase subunit